MSLSTASVIEVDLGRFPSVFGRVRGRNGVVMEYRALLSPLYEYCVMPKVDAYRLGYPEVAFQHPTVDLPNSMTLLTCGGYSKTVRFEVDSVEIGQIRLPKVEFVAYDLPQASGFDAVFGRSLLRDMNMFMDFSAGILKLWK